MWESRQRAVAGSFFVRIGKVAGSREGELGENIPGDGIGFLGDIDGEGGLVGGGWFEGFQLALEERGGHVVILPFFEARLKNRFGGVQEEEGWGVGAVVQFLAIGFFEGGTGDKFGGSVVGLFVHDRGNGVQPFGAIGVGERDAAAHFFDVFR